MLLPLLILLVCSLAVMLFALNALFIQKKKSSTGIEAEGIIFDFQKTDSPNESMVFPTVRFLTANQVWITKASKLGVIPGIYKKGQRITVVYQKDLPEDFFIQDNSRYLVPIAMLLISFSLLIFAIYKLINI